MIRLFAELLGHYLRGQVEFIEFLVELATLSARSMARRRRNPAARKRGCARVPGSDTPLWSALVRQVAPLLRKRGSKVKLARFLGISKQRVHICFKARTGTLDAECTLMLLSWLAVARRRRRVH